MPRQVFSEEVEAKLIQLWGEHVKKKSGTMMKRSVKEKEVAEALTAYSRQLGDTESVYTASVIHSKIDNLKTKAKEHYKRFRRMTATGSPVGDTSEDGACTLIIVQKTGSRNKPQRSLNKINFIAKINQRHSALLTFSGQLHRQSRRRLRAIACDVPGAALNFSCMCEQKMRKSSVLGKKTLFPFK